MKQFIDILVYLWNDEAWLLWYKNTKTDKGWEISIKYKTFVLIIWMCVMIMCLNFDKDSFNITADILNIIVSLIWITINLVRNFKRLPL